MVAYTQKCYIFEGRGEHFLRWYGFMIGEKERMCVRSGNVSEDVLN